MNKELAAQQAVEWFRINEPFIYHVAAKRLELKNAGLAGVDWGSMLSSIGSTLKSVATDVAPQYLQYKQQKRVMDMQMKRAESGLPPANVEDYAPVVRIAPEITPETEQAITRAAIKTSESAANKMLPWLAIGGLGAVLIFMKMGKKRRR